MNLDQNNEPYYGNPGDPRTGRARQRIHWVCRQAIGRDVLDLACGSGIACLILGTEGFRCTGINVDSESLQRAEQGLAKQPCVVRERVKFQVAEATELPFEDESFDTVIAGEVLQNFIHPERLLSEAKRVLRKHGRVIITVPCGLLPSGYHKITYYPVTLLQMLQPFFSTVEIDVVGEYITYAGVREAAHANGEDPKQIPFEQYLRLQEAFEARCLERETALLELELRIKAQIGGINEELAVLAWGSQEIERPVGVRPTRNAAFGVGVEEHQVVSKPSAGACADDRLERSGFRSEVLAPSAIRSNGANGLGALGSKPEIQGRGWAAREAFGQSLERKFGGSNEALIELSCELAKARTAVASFAAHAALIKGQLTDKQAELATLKEEQRQFTVSPEQTCAREKEVARLTTELAISAEHLTAAQLERQQAQQRLLTGEAELRRFQAELAAAKAALQQNDKKCVTLHAELEKFRQELNREKADGRKRLLEAESRHASQLRDCEKRWKELLAQREEELKYTLLNQRIRQLAHGVLPAGARVLVISKGDGELLRLDGCISSHFPQTLNGVYAGHHPTDSSEAISHLENLRSQGAEYLLIPASSFWWLEYYTAFHQHLKNRYRLVTYGDGTCIIFALDASPSPGATFQFSAASPAALSTTVDVASGARLLDKAVAPAPQSTITPGTDEPAHVSTGSAGRAQRREDVKERSARPTVACIADEFTRACLTPEWSLVTFGPDNWNHVLEETSIDLLFVESAWHGNDNSWENQIALPSGVAKGDLANLIQYCRTRDIPTVFWNKEDPSHFTQFIDRAPLFDFVFTTDSDCISRYRERVGHDRVFALPFAAQPTIHNPVKEEPRDRAVCFAGSYYGDRHRERQCDLDYVLRPAIDFGLEIYDRQHGMTGKGLEAYRFPDAYQPFIKGRLTYDQMVKVYKKYRVFLNVNTVKKSPTMFSRRVFELLACGTPVISTYSEGICELLGKETVFFTDSAAETVRHLEYLLSSEEAWSRHSVRGLRKVMQAHTYRDRLQEVFRRVGIHPPDAGQDRISVVVRLRAAADLQRVISLISAQTFAPIELLLISTAPLAQGALTMLRNAMPQIAVTNVDSEAKGSLARCLAASPAEYLAFLDLRDSYGPNYLEDLRLAAMYSGSDFLGKHSFYELAGPEVRSIRRPGNEYHRVDCVESATLLSRKSALSQEFLNQALDSRAFRVPGRLILSLDRFNYLQNAGGTRDCALEKGQHAELCV